MKNILITIFLVAPVVMMAQQSYIIKGQIGKTNSPAKVYLSYRELGTEKLDSAVLSNGFFEFKGRVKSVNFAELIMNYKGTGLPKLHRTDGSYAVVFYITPGTTLVQGSDSLYKAKISGIQVNEDFVAYNKLIKRNSIKQQTLRDEYTKLSAEKSEFKT